MRHRHARRGISSIQWIGIAAVTTLVVVATIQIVGTRTRSKLNETVTDVGNPQNLTTRFTKQK